MNKIATLDEQVPLESVLIGNGIFSDTKQASSYYDIPCTNVTGIGPLLDSEVCERMAGAVGRCEYLMEACHAYPDPLICRASSKYCQDELETPYVRSGRNYYDISRPCEGYVHSLVHEKFSTKCFTRSLYSQSCLKITHVSNANLRLSDTCAIPS